MRCQMPVKFGIAASELRLVGLDAVHDRFRREVRVAQPNEVPAARSDIARHDVPVVAERALHAGVELHDVRRLQIAVHRLQLRADVGVGVEVGDDVRERRVDDRRARRERRVEAAGEEVVLRQDLIVEDAEAGAHGGLAVAERIPDEPEPRREVLERRVVVPRIADGQRRRR